MNALEIALDLIRRGIAPIPVPVGSKNPIIEGWPHLRITAENAAQYFNGAALNVGAIWGPMSNGLVDVDLDCIEAVKLAPYFLPRTGSIYGRAGKKRSHYLYRCTDISTAPKKAVRRLSDENNVTIIELRYGGGDKGAQSVMPGSIYSSETGERYGWDADGDPGNALFADLMASIIKNAVGSILMRHWPPENGRHDVALGIGGFLSRAGWTPDAIGHFVETICHQTDGSEWASDHNRTARESAEAHAEGGEARGFPWMTETFGAAVAKKIAKLVGLKGAIEEPTPENDRPILKVVGGKLSELADRAEEILIADNVQFFERSNALVRPIVKTTDAFHGRKTTVAQFFEVEKAYMRDVLARKVNWYSLSLREKQWVAIDPPHDVASTILARAGEWTFPTAAGIITTQTMRPDGTILSQPGYDPVTRLLLVDPPPMEAIPEAPTRDDAIAALKVIKDLLSEFMFVDAVARAVALSTLITPVVRGAFADAHARRRRPSGILRQELSVRHVIRHRHRTAHAGDRRRPHRGGNGEETRQCIDCRSAIDRHRQRQWRASRRCTVPDHRAITAPGPRTGQVGAVQCRDQRHDAVRQRQQHHDSRRSLPPRHPLQARPGDGKTRDKGIHR
jgi:Bifunctional DNA primase/polymerase, N-terminal